MLEIPLQSPVLKFSSINMITEQLYILCIISTQLMKVLSIKNTCFYHVNLQLKT